VCRRSKEGAKADRRERGKEEGISDVVARLGVIGTQPEVGCYDATVLVLALEGGREGWREGGLA